MPGNKMADGREKNAEISKRAMMDGNRAACLKHNDVTH